jgi:hypothetical protein
MSPDEAKAVLNDVEGILQLISQYHRLSEEQRLALHSRAGLARQKIGDVVKLLRKFERTDQIKPQESD